MEKKKFPKFYRTISLVDGVKFRKDLSKFYLKHLINLDDSTRSRCIAFKSLDYFIINKVILTTTTKQYKITKVFEILKVFVPVF